MVLYWTRSLSFTKFLGCDTTVLLPNKSSGREVQPLAALYPTVRLSPWRQVEKNIHSRVWTPSRTWSILPPGGPPLLVPLSSWWLGDMGLTPGDYQDSCPGWLPPYHFILSPNRRASLLLPLPVDSSTSPPPEVCPLPFCVWHLA